METTGSIVHHDGLSAVSGLGEGGAYYVPGFDGEHVRRFEALLKNATWIQPHFRGKPMRRKKATFVEFDADGTYPLYRYTGHYPEVEPMPEELRALGLACHGHAGVGGPAPNHCIATLYRNGEAGIGLHSDNPKYIAVGSSIWDVSLGAPRVLRLQRKQGGRAPVQITLRPGSLFVLDAATNAAWLHQLLEDKEVTEPRISLVWRAIASRRHADVTEASRRKRARTPDTEPDAP